MVWKGAPYFRGSPLRIRSTHLDRSRWQCCGENIVFFSLKSMSLEYLKNWRTLWNALVFSQTFQMDSFNVVSRVSVHTPALQVRVNLFLRRSVYDVLSLLLALLFVCVAWLNCVFYDVNHTIYVTPTCYSFSSLSPQSTLLMMRASVYRQGTVSFSVVLLKVFLICYSRNTWCFGLATFCL